MAGCRATGGRDGGPAVARYPDDPVGRPLLAIGGAGRALEGARVSARFAQLPRPSAWLTRAAAQLANLPGTQPRVETCDELLSHQVELLCPDRGLAGDRQHAVVL